MCTKKGHWKVGFLGTDELVRAVFFEGLEHCFGQGVLWTFLGSLFLVRSERGGNIEAKLGTTGRSELASPRKAHAHFLIVGWGSCRQLLFSSLMA